MSTEMDSTQSSIIKKGPYIPKYIKLPGPYVVTVRQIIPTKMLEIHGQVYDGIFDPINMTLDMNVRLERERKWFVYGQEVIHVVEAWNKWLIKEGIAVR